MINIQVMYLNLDRQSHSSIQLIKNVHLMNELNLE